MCRYCDSNILDALAINSKDEAVIINQDTETGEYFIDGLDERVYIDYCPMCRKEVRRVKVEQFEIKSVERIPHSLEEGIIYICLECKVAVHLCACGCKEKTVTPLGDGGWTLNYNENGLSLNPSIGNFNIPCKSHYFITNNKVRWC